MTVICNLSEPPAVQPQEDGQPHESEWRGNAELLPQIKEESKHPNFHTEQEDGDSEDGTCSQQEPHPAHTVCSRQFVPSPTLTNREMKAESDRDERGDQHQAEPLPSSMTVYSNCRAVQSSLCASTAKSHRPQKTEPQVKGLLRSNGKQNALLLQLKNVRTLKPPPPRPSHPSQSIQRWHSCKECGKGFSFACQLEVHMRWHTKEKPYSCTVCRKSFTTVSMLKRHHRIHTGEKPFRCHVCGKCFNQSAHLNTHFRLHTRERASWSRAPHSK